MYLRPRQIFEKFLVEEKISRIDSRGRQVVEFKPTGEEIFCVVNDAFPKEIEKFKSVHHEITHTLIQRYGRTKAKVGDRLVGGARKFLVQTLDDPGGVGFWIVYFCVERFDL